MFEVFGPTGPPALGGRHFGFHFATHCNADKRTRNAVTRCVLRAYNAAKCHCDRPGPGGVAYGVPQTAYLVLKGRFAAGRGGNGKGRDGQRGEGKEVDTDAQLEQGRRLAKAGPGLVCFVFYVD